MVFNTLGRRNLIGAAGLFVTAPLKALAANTKPRVTITTGHGVIVVELETVKAPLTCTNFLRYVDAHRYDGGSFYRASREPGASGSGNIEGGPNPGARRFPAIAHESTTMTGLRHRAGTISVARNEPGSATGDFFICASAQPYLDAHPGGNGDNQGFAAFGQVVKGMDVVRTILALKTDGKATVAAMKGQMLNPPVPIVSMARV